MKKMVEQHKNQTCISAELQKIRRNQPLTSFKCSIAQEAGVAYNKARIFFRLRLSPFSIHLVLMSVGGLSLE